MKNMYSRENEMSDMVAACDCVIVPPIKTADGAYREPGLPRPPAGYGRKLPVTEVEGAGPGSREEDTGE